MKNNSYLGYGITAVFTAAVVALQFFAFPALQHTSLLLLSFAVITVVSIFGPGPGLFAVVLTTVAAFFVLRGAGAASLAGELFQVSMYAALCAGVIAHIGRGQRAARTVEDQARKLRAHEETLRAIVENTPDSIFLKDRDGRFVLMNPAGLRVIGKPADQVIGRTSREVYDDPEIGEALMKIDRRIMESGITERCEDRISTSAGTRLFESTKSPQRGADGRIIGLVGIARDVTEHRHTEDRFRSLFENMLNGLVHARMIFDENGRPVDFVVLDVNSALYRLTGLKDVVGKKASEILPGFPNSNPELFEAYARVAATGHAETYEARVSQIDADFFVSIYSPEIGHFVAILENTTARKRAEQESVHSRELLRNIIDSSPANIFVKDLDGRYLLVNDCVARTFNRSKDKIIGAMSYGFFPARLAERMRAFDLKVVSTGETVEAEQQLEFDGRSEDHLIIRFPLRDKTGRIFAVGGISTDITKMKRLESDLKKALADARRALRIRDEFLSIASHELKTPVAAVLLQNEAVRRLLSGELSEDRKNRLAAAVESSTRQVDKLAGLTEALLNTAKIQSGKLSLERTGVDLNQLVRDVAQRLADMLSQAGCRVRLELGAGIVGRWDPLRLEQVLVNLLTNICRYAAKATVTVSTFRDGDRAVLIVADDGPGISKLHQKTLFDRFARVTTPTGIGGLGLGLHIARSIVERHGGSVRLDSDVGKGAKFIIELPLVPSEVAA